MLSASEIMQLIQSLIRASVLISAFIDNIPYVATMIPAYNYLWLAFGG